MLCEICKKKNANVHVTQIMNNEKTQLFICDECAAKLNNPISFQDFFKDIIDMAMNLKNTNQIKQIYACPTCGLTYTEFRQIGKLGCSDCYKTFNEQLLQLFKSIHGNTRHTGKVPQKSGVELLKKREITELKEKLIKAIAEEEFETAAELRDKIHALEGVK